MFEGDATMARASDAVPAHVGNVDLQVPMPAGIPGGVCPQGYRVVPGQFRVIGAKIALASGATGNLAFQTNTSGVIVGVAFDSLGLGGAGFEVNNSLWGACNAITSSDSVGGELLQQAGTIVNAWLGLLALASVINSTSVTNNTGAEATIRGAVLLAVVCPAA